MTSEIELLNACIAGDLSKAKLLLKLVDINAILSEGKSALCWSVGSGHFELTRFLLNEGANPNFQESEEGESVLIFAIQELAGSEMVSMMRLLLEKGALVDLPDFLGWTPLMHAKSYQEHDAIPVLLEFGAKDAPVLK